MSEIKMVTVIRKDLNMRKGKMCAQSQHACLGVFLGMAGSREGKKLTLHLTPEAQQWMGGNYKKVVVGVNSELELLSIYEMAREAGLPVYMVTDSGVTEFNGEATRTCLAIGPASDYEIDKITGTLGLL
jgi:PTH2 family peptidyl-tRNA hydrolase